MTGLSQTGLCFQNAQQNTEWYSSNTLYSTNRHHTGVTRCQQLAKTNYLEPVNSQPQLSRNQHTTRNTSSSYDTNYGKEKMIRNGENAAVCNWLMSNRGGRVTQAQPECPVFQAHFPLPNSVMHNQQLHNSVNTFLPHSAGHIISSPHMPTTDLDSSHEHMITNKKMFSSQSHHVQLNSIHDQTFSNRLISNENHLNSHQLFGSSSKSNHHQSNISRIPNCHLNLYQQNHSNITPLANHCENQFMHLSQSAHNVCQPNSSTPVLTSRSHCSLNSYRPTRNDFGPFQVSSHAGNGNPEVAVTPAFEGRTSCQMGNFPASVYTQGYPYTYQYAFRQALKNNSALKKQNINNPTKSHFISTVNANESQKSSTFSDSFTMQRWYKMPTEDKSNGEETLCLCKDTSKVSAGCENVQSLMSTNQTESAIKEKSSSAKAGSNSTSSLEYDNELLVHVSSCATNPDSHKSEQSRDDGTHVPDCSKTKRFVSSEVRSDGESQVKNISNKHCGNFTSLVNLEPTRYDYVFSDNSSSESHLASLEEAGANPSERFRMDITSPLLKIQKETQDSVNSDLPSLSKKRNLSLESSEESLSYDYPLPAIKHVLRKSSKISLKPLAVSEKSILIGDIMDKNSDADSENCETSKVSCFQQFNDVSNSCIKTKLKKHKVCVEMHVKKNKSKNVTKDHNEKTSLRKSDSVMKVKLSFHSGKHKKKHTSHISVRNSYQTSKSRKGKHFSCHDTPQSVSSTMGCHNRNSFPTSRSNKDHRLQSNRSDRPINSPKHMSNKKHHLTRKQNDSSVKQRHSCTPDESSISCHKHFSFVEKRNEHLESSKQDPKAKLSTSFKNVSQNVQILTNKNVDIARNDVHSKTPNISSQDQISKQGESPESTYLDVSGKQCCSLTFDKKVVLPREFEIVKYHGKQLLCLNLLDGKYFIMKEFVAKCFTVSRTKVIQAKSKVLHIKHCELDNRYRKEVIRYLRESAIDKRTWLKSDQNLYLGIILIQDANKVFHLLNSIKTNTRNSKRPKAKCSILKGSETKGAESEKLKSDTSVVRPDNYSTNDEKIIASNHDGTNWMQASDKTFDQKDTDAEDEISSVSSDSTMIYCDGMGVKKNNSNNVFLDENSVSENLSTEKVAMVENGNAKAAREKCVANQKTTGQMCETSDLTAEDELNTVLETCPSDDIKSQDTHVSSKERTSVHPEKCVLRVLTDDKNNCPASLEEEKCVSSEMNAKENYEAADSSLRDGDKHNQLALNEAVIISSDSNSELSSNDADCVSERTLENCTSQSNDSFGISDSVETDCSLRQHGNDESQTIDSGIMSTSGTCDASPETSNDLQLGVTVTKDTFSLNCDALLTTCKLFESQSHSQTTSCTSSDLLKSVLATDFDLSTIPSGTQSTLDAIDQLTVPVAGFISPCNDSLPAGLDDLTVESNMTQAVKKEIIPDDQSSKRADKISLGR